jgi:type I restriction enzyme S subunit
LVRFSSGGTPDKGKSEYWNGSIPWVSPKDMKRDAIGDSEDHVTEAALEGTVIQLLPVGSVLVVVRGMILAHTLPVAVTTGPVTINQDIKALHCDRVLSPRFLQVVLQGQAHWLLSQADQSAHGTKKIETDVLKQFEVPCPDLSVQRAIVEYLDRQTGRLDALIAGKERVLDLLAEKRKAVIASAVTRGLDPALRPRDSGVAWLSVSPRHWRATRLKFVATVQTGIAIGKSFSDRATREYPYLRVANVQDGFLALADVKTLALPEQEASLCRLQPGDVLMNEGGDADKLGRGAIWRGEIDPCLHQNHVFAVRPRSVSSEWLNAWISTDFAKAYFESRAKQATNLASISATNLMELPLLVPPELEQRAIVEHIARETTKIDEVRAATERTVDLLKERRAALIAAAVSGQLGAMGNAS